MKANNDMSNYERNNRISDSVNSSVNNNFANMYIDKFAKIPTNDGSKKPMLDLDRHLSGNKRK
jgi:hypothetical protein